MTSFEAVVEYAGKKVKVKSDSFAELHQTLAGIEELNRDAAYLQRQGIDDVIPVYRKDGQENEYFGLQDRFSRKNVTFGTKREKGLIPFFPKGEDGYYDPDTQGPRSQSNGSQGSRSNGRSRDDRSPREENRSREERSQQPQRRPARQGRPQQQPEDFGGRRDDLPF